MVESFFERSKFIPIDSLTTPDSLAANLGNDQKVNKVFGLSISNNYYTEFCMIAIVSYCCAKYLMNKDNIPEAVKIKTSFKTGTKLTYCDQSVQTDSEIDVTETNLPNIIANDEQKRPIQELVEIVKAANSANTLTDGEVHELLKQNQLQLYRLDTLFDDPRRGVNIRRSFLEDNFEPDVFRNIPYESYDYKRVIGKCCENVIGYVPIPLGIVGPLLIDSKLYRIPMATSEGTLIASTNRGCNALRNSGGVITRLISDGITRGPVLSFPSATNSTEVKKWIEVDVNFERLKKAFDASSRYLLGSNVRFKNDWPI